MPMLFIETDSPPPFYQAHLTPKQRQQLDQWFIGHRSQAYYLKRFAEFDEQGHLSPKWHWAAFFMTLPWLLYRKRYMDAIVYSVAGWSFIHLNITLVLVAFEFLAMGWVPEAYQMAVRVVIASVIWLFWAVMVARWSDAYYYRMARREIADALADHARDQAAQQAKLRHEGGVSLIGLGLGFGFFAFVLMVIRIQFLPLYAKQQEQELVYEAYVITRESQRRVAELYSQTGQCPIQAPLHTDHPHLSLALLPSLAAVPGSDCIVKTTMQHVAFPNRYLNGQTLVMYHVGEAEEGSRWGCMSSLNKKQKPKQCLD